MNAKKPNANAAPSMSTAAISAIQSGNKIAAIKIVRQERNISLKEAKDAVEAYARSQPSVQAPSTGAQAETRWSTIVWIVVLVGLVLIAYRVLVNR